MSEEDLEQSGVLLPKDQWGKSDLNTTLNKPGAVVSGTLCVLSCVAMYWGDGSWLTWLGAFVYLASMAFFVWLAFRAVEREVSAK